MEEEEVVAAGAGAGAIAGAVIMGGEEDEDGVERGPPLPREATILPPPPSSSHTAYKSLTTPRRYPGREKGSKDEALGLAPPALSFLLPLPVGVVGVVGKSSNPG